ncbi:uncharacterized protein LOC133151352 isoform X1 [Syngnathus typhle]|uniref:uncharacterized protein LOC133151352 isoform X1 n=1 Tax=Syngnathus typhle TaxID=161592 RepID=UPI002A69E387|nr:uncharacterized protein LOC133151352 isoform X1 [Syngnathus typhle]XP_061130283.1 uncharacterized protein LOC133151352 isoform X1 [Syngnathus typhle]XP_061130284.1 uncharacterized protein LOC133151352 isoform X1 [Syngnathus typhle]
MDPVEWENASLRQQRNLNLVQQRDIHDMEVNGPHCYCSDGEPLEDDGPELTRKLNLLRDIEERILHKKAAILIKTFEMIKKKPLDSKAKTLKDRVSTILQQRHCLNSPAKCKMYVSPERDDSPSHSREWQEDHPLKRRVEALMRHRFCDHSGSTTKNPASAHEIATPPVTPPPRSQSITSQIQKDNVANKGFERFLSLLNKGVDMNLLSRIVNDDSEHLQLGDQPFNSQHSSVKDDLHRPTSNESLQCNSGAQLLENGGERAELSTSNTSLQCKSGVQLLHSGGDGAELSTSKHYRKERLSLSNDNNMGKDKHTSGSNSVSKSPPTVEQSEKEEKEMVVVDEQHEQLQNILNTLGLSLEMEDLSKLTHRTQERLYGKRNESKSVSPSTTEQPVSPVMSGSCKSDRKSSSSSLSPSRSCRRSPSHRQLSHHRVSRDRHEQDSLLACGDSRKKTENSFHFYKRQNDVQEQKTVGINNDANISYESPYVHSHCDPDSSFHCPDYDLSNFTHHYSSCSGDTNQYWTSTTGASVPPHYSGSYPYSMDTHGSHCAIPSVQHNGHSFLDVSFVNPDLSTSEGQFGSVTAPRNLHVVKMKQPRRRRLPQKRFEQGKARWLKWMGKQSRNVQMLRALSEIPLEVKETKASGKQAKPTQDHEKLSRAQSEIPFEVKETKASGKQAKPTQDHGKHSRKQQTQTDEEIKANLRKMLETFNQMSKNKSHAPPNSYPDTQLLCVLLLRQMCDVGL